MRIQTLARIFGVVYLVVGIAGFVTMIAPPAPPDAEVISIATAYSWLLGIFPVNAAHDIVHIAVGLGGLLFSIGPQRARAYFRVMCVLFALLTIMGAFRITSTLFGAAPVYGWDVALHAVTALFALFAGWGPPSHDEPLLDMSLPPPPPSMPAPPSAAPGGA